jgi:hypothetical protein
MIQQNELPHDGVQLPKTKRNRIPLKRGIPAIIDEDSYIPNRATQRSKKLSSSKPEVTVHLCVDQHYLDRNQHGEDDGSCRDGIDSDTVSDLVTRAFGHLLYYGCQIDKFKFINLVSDVRSIRTILREETEKGMLHVAIETHLIDAITYEITVITAMVNDDFRIGDSQFCVELHEAGSELYRMINKKLELVSGV